MAVSYCLMQVWDKVKIGLGYVFRLPRSPTAPRYSTRERSAFGLNARARAYIRLQPVA